MTHYFKESLSIVILSLAVNFISECTEGSLSGDVPSCRLPLCLQQTAVQGSKEETGEGELREWLLSFLFMGSFKAKWRCGGFERGEEAQEDDPEAEGGGACRFAFPLTFRNHCVDAEAGNDRHVF